VNTTFALLCLTFAAPQAEIHGRSRTTVVVGSQPIYSSSRGALELQRFAPITEELSLRATPNIEGVELTFAAWTAIDPGERFFAEPVLADLTILSLAWRTSLFSARAGRLFLFNETGRALHFDGGSFALHGASGPIRLESETWIGVPVSTAYGEEPLRDTYPTAASDPLFYAPRGSDWSRPGDFAFGARVGGSVLDVVSLFAGYAHERDLAEIDRESLSGRLSITPFRGWALESFASFDLYAGAVEDAELHLSYWPDRSLRTAIYARRRAPALLLPSTSIFSVFAGEDHEEAGLEADYFVWRELRLSASAELRRTAVQEEEALGYRLSAGLRAQLIFWPGARSAFSYERLSDPWFGHYDYLRASLELPMSELFVVAPDAGIFLVERSGSSMHLAGRIGVAAKIQVDPVFFVLATRATQNERGDRELAVIGRVEWNAEYSF
jgi:hypothetical protein